MTIDLLNKDKSSDVSDQNGVGSAIDFYPQFAGFGSYASVDEAMNRADLRCFAFSSLIGFYNFLGFESTIV